MSRPDPKAVAGSVKPQLWLVPPSGVKAAALAFEQGAEKYGAFNWREDSKGINVSAYISAAERHIGDFRDGENMVPDNVKCHHLGAAIASLMIILDAMAAGTLVDDRPKPLSKPMWVNRTMEAILAEQNVAVSKALVEIGLLDEPAEPNHMYGDRGITKYERPKPSRADIDVANLTSK